jgi:transposase
VASTHNPHKHTITRILDKLWDEVVAVLPKEKPDSTIGRPIVPYGKVMDGIVCVLRIGCQWKMLSKEYGSGSTSHRRFHQWLRLGTFEKMWVKVLK